MAEYTNRVAPERGSINHDFTRGFIKHYDDNTIRVPTAESSQVKLAWPDVVNPLQNSTNVPAKSRPMAVRCLNCNSDVITELNYQSGGLTWVLCCLLAAAGGVLGCCLLPFYISRFKNVLHSCPKCKANLAVHYRL